MRELKLGDFVKINITSLKGSFGFIFKFHDGNEALPCVRVTHSKTHKYREGYRTGYFDRSNDLSLCCEICFKTDCLTIV